MAGTFSKLKTLFFHPAQFFKSVEKEKDYWPPLAFFATIYIITSVLQIIFRISLSLKTPAGILLLITSLLGIFFSLIIAFVAPFISAAITHLGVLLFGGKNGFYNTFKPVSYAGAIVIVYSLITSLLTSLLLIFIPTNITNLEDTSALALFGSRGAGFLLVVLIAILSFIHTLYAEISGISKFQQMSSGRAFLSVIIIPAILILLFVGIFVLLLAPLLPVQEGWRAF